METPTEVSIVLEKDKSYFVVGEGTCSLWNGQDDGCDSVYRYRTPLEPNGGEIKVWGQLQLIDPNVHLSDLLIKQTGKEDPGYNPDHKYEAVVIGEGKTLKARVFDGGGYGDNHGELKISVYEAICKEKSCQDICKEIEHLVSDEESKSPNCNCICEKGWQKKEGVCESCGDYCGRIDENSLFNPERSGPDQCDCTNCKDGYKYDEIEQKCKKVKSCSEICSESTIEHLVPDERAPSCECICGKGWQDKNGVCESCEDACKRQDPNSLYDPENSVANHCVCREKEQTQVVRDIEPKGDVAVKKESGEKKLTKESGSRSLCKNCCKGVKPEDYDLTYDETSLKVQMRTFIKDYSWEHPLKKGTALPQLKGYFGYNKFSLSFYLGEGNKDPQFTTGNEDKLRARIQERFKEQGAPLTPSQVFEESLKLNNDYVFDALLTVHNLLRDDGEEYRTAIGHLDRLDKAMKGAANQERLSELMQEKQKANAQLSKQRNIYDGVLEPIRKSDKSENVGCWYHLFGCMVESFAYPIFGQMVVKYGEPMFLLWKDQPKEDPQKHCVDEWGGKIGLWLYEGRDINIGYETDPSLKYAPSSSTAPSDSLGTSLEDADPSILRHLSETRKAIGGS
jgi:hypothetical protein